jgi:arsenate reductase
MSDKPGIVFVCVANSFRSQMAEGIARHVAGDRWDVYSAGSSPGGGVHPMAIALMDEVGVDLRGNASKGIDDLHPRPHCARHTIIT